jgi:hypothetical protein
MHWFKIIPVDADFCFIGIGDFRYYYVVTTGQESVIVRCANSQVERLVAIDTVNPSLGFVHGMTRELMWDHDSASESGNGDVQPSVPIERYRRQQQQQQHCCRLCRRCSQRK